MQVKLDSQTILRPNKTKITAGKRFFIEVAWNNNNNTNKNSTEWDTGWVGGPEVIVEVRETIGSVHPASVNETLISTGKIKNIYFFL